MKKAGVLTALFILLLSATALMNKPYSIGVDQTLRHFTANGNAFVASLQRLQVSVKNITAAKQTLQAAQRQLAACRTDYKRIEAFVEYFFEPRIRIFNGAPVPEAEEPFMEYQSPVGLQVMEELLFDAHPERKKAELLAQTEVMLLTAAAFPAYLHNKEITDEAVTESIRLQLVRVIALGITGYDAPQLKTGIGEAAVSLQTIEQTLQPYLEKASAERRAYLQACLRRCLQALAEAPSFDDFNRLQFLTEAALPLQEELGLMIKELGLQHNGASLLNNKAANLFQPDALRPSAFAGTNKADSGLIALGKALFFEPQLSGNGVRSCATCHRPTKYFTDGLPQSPALNGHGTVGRNAPSLLYASYQWGQFWDARAVTLEEQVEKVLLSETEMAAGRTDFRKELQPAYADAFRAVFGNNDSAYSVRRIAKAIAAYERSLPVMTSAFDDYIAGSAKALSPKAIKGFNLFTGKAQCGTCHFAPLFNGLLPPLYNRTELESLGMTSTANFKRPVADGDSGRYRTYPIEFYTGAFKTPTVRNSAATAPYMHNGAFKTLEDVIEFYNRGGGAGLGLEAPHQTLPNKPLGLSANEKACLVAFLRALTDGTVAN